jgi:hypothetical protein
MSIFNGVDRTPLPPKFSKIPYILASCQFLPTPLPTSRLRQALALPIYTIALVLDSATAGLGRLAALVASDDWPA